MTPVQRELLTAPMPTWCRAFTAFTSFFSQDTADARPVAAQVATAALSQCTDIVIHSSMAPRIVHLFCSDAFTENGEQAPLFAAPAPAAREIAQVYFHRRDYL